MQDAATTLLLLQYLHYKLLVNWQTNCSLLTPCTTPRSPLFKPHTLGLQMTEMWYGIPLTQWTSLFLKGACGFSCVQKEQET